LKSHYIGDAIELISGIYDSNFLGFIQSRYKYIEPLFKELKRASNNLTNGKYIDIWDEI